MQSSNFRLESAYGRVLNMEHSARQQVAKLRQKYDEMENEALMEIQGVSAELINTLLETNDQLKRYIHFIILLKSQSVIGCVE
jgi:hypothetical protein